MAVIEKYLGLPYKYHHHPQTELSEEDLQQGVNCELLVHLIYRDLFGVTLPTEMRSQEILEDQSMFLEAQIVDSTPNAGDIFFFGRETTPPNRLHLAVFTGDYSVEGEPLLAHANMYDGVSVWPLSKFFQYPRYQQLKTVKRLRNHK